MATRRTKETQGSASPSSPAAPQGTRRAKQSQSAGGPAQEPDTAINRVLNRVAVTPEIRRGMIAEAAYLRAERRSFAPGSEVEDWLAAEREIDALLSRAQGARQ